MTIANSSSSSGLFEEDPHTAETEFAQRMSVAADRPEPPPSSSPNFREEIFADFGSPAPSNDANELFDVELFDGLNNEELLSAMEAIEGIA